MIRTKKIRFRIGFLIGFIIFSFAISRLYYTIKTHEKIEEKLNSEYSTLLIQDSLEGVVLSTYYPEGWRGGKVIQNVKLKNGKSYTIRIKRNLKPRNVFFGDILEPGAVLKKSADSDTLIVFIGDDEYKYLIYGFE
jgi:hypothetical protein